VAAQVCTVSILFLQLASDVFTDLCSQLQLKTKFADVGENSITISQSKYVESILKCEGMDLEKIKPVKSPLDPNVQLVPNPEGTNGDRSKDYASLLRALQFLTCATCPNITYAISQLSRFIANPSKTHYAAAK